LPGWVPFDADGWPEASEAIARPWPPAFAAFDLRWDADQRRRGLGRGHGRPYWASRWGWTDWAVKSLLRSGTWQDPAKSETVGGQQSGAFRQPASEPPARRQPAASRRKAERQQPEAFRQPTASPPPADRHARDYSTEHNAHTQGPPSPPAGGIDPALLSLARRIRTLAEGDHERALEEHEALVADEVDTSDWTEAQRSDHARWKRTPPAALDGLLETDKNLSHWQTRLGVGRQRTVREALRLAQTLGDGP
jgi:hypothetical protein